MKKALIILFTVLLICGCSKQKELEERYYDYVKETNECVYFNDQEYPFDIDITLEKLNDNYLIYRVFIDNPKENLYDIEALVTHNYETDDVFPSSGLYEEPLDLLINEDSEDYIKGIILSGYIETTTSIEDINITFKALIKAKSKFGYYEEFCYEKSFSS